VGAARLLKLLGILGVQLVLSKPASSPKPPPTGPESQAPSW